MGWIGSLIPTNIDTNALLKVVLSGSLFWRSVLQQLYILSKKCFFFSLLSHFTVFDRFLNC